MDSASIVFPALPCDTSAMLRKSSVVYSFIDTLPQQGFRTARIGPFRCSTRSPSRCLAAPALSKRSNNHPNNGLGQLGPEDCTRITTNCQSAECHKPVLTRGSGARCEYLEIAKGASAVLRFCVLEGALQTASSRAFSRAPMQE
jgi:hypothetical protein